ncbi:expressed unknown protein [Seminavis robusta]|uniref:Exostosin GT47 domain-containing protein n=1 Tax=Seminavis robusta TaxID=568900 RepID=A0A9N8HAM0_9STRA|nr:expressed unknown protein [Seminavis robusta]|eukprot:Sro325_g117720.1 n/a (532) ;mRNA; f:13058-14653
MTSFWQSLKTFIRVLSYIVLLVPGLTLLRLVQDGSLRNPVEAGCTVEAKELQNAHGSETISANQTLKNLSHVPVHQELPMPPRLRFFDLQDAILNLSQLPDELDPRKGQGNLHNAFQRATVVKEASWLPKRRLCRDSCCVETVAISLEQDERQFMHDKAGLDLADLMMPAAKQPPNEVFAVPLQEEMLPCLVPGTIITVENHRWNNRQFWQQIRPNIHVPYVLMTTGSDDDSPSKASPSEYITDPLMIKWYGSNPLYHQNRIFQDHLHSDNNKFQTFNLGLSHRFAQEKYLRPYLKLTNYTNPFLNKDRWNLTNSTFDYDKDVFVHFGLRRQHRQELWQRLCPNTTEGGGRASCNQETNGLPTPQIYADMSRYRFAVSPTGAGYDCYRTYETLLLGVIPIIEERPGASQDLFAGLPVVHMPDLNQATKDDIAAAIQNYVASDEFQKASFQDGWARLFFKEKRRQLLRDTGRQKDILLDDKGKEYYQAYKYTVVEDDEIVDCWSNKNCVLHKRKDGASDFVDVMDWITKWGK